MVPSAFDIGISMAGVELYSEMSPTSNSAQTISDHVSGLVGYSSDCCPLHNPTTKIMTLSAISFDRHLYNMMVHRRYSVPYSITLTLMVLWVCVCIPCISIQGTPFCCLSSYISKTSLLKAGYL
ncbi:hypothetical protein TNCV_2299741 [Trichonephila clavipes]|nr:hypothetical protein TNCV_2299741 [Trichonephila clavipes]